MATDALSNDPHLALPVELHPNIDHLVTEDDTPVDNVFSEKQQRLLTEPLYSSWSAPEQQRPFVAMANVGLFYHIRRPPLVPDVLLALDVEVPSDIHLKSSRSYFTWEYGKPPDIVIEIVSNREGGEDSHKLSAYSRIRVPYYVIHDPEQILDREMLRVYGASPGEYSRIAEPFWFPEVGLGLQLWNGMFEELDAQWLRWVDSQGRPVPTGRERADAEKQRADAEQQRAERLAEQLRQAGIEPR